MDGEKQARIKLLYKRKGAIIKRIKWKINYLYDEEQHLIRMEHALMEIIEQIKNLENEQ